MGVIEKIAKWWNRPPAEDRILDAMSFTEWRRSLKIIDNADVGVGQFYVICERLSEEGIIEKRYDRSGPYTRTYCRKLKSGKRRPVNDNRQDAVAVELSPAI